MSVLTSSSRSRARSVSSVRDSTDAIVIAYRLPFRCKVVEPIMWGMALRSVGVRQLKERMSQQLREVNESRLG